MHCRQSRGSKRPSIGGRARTLAVETATNDKAAFERFVCGRLDCAARLPKSDGKASRCHASAPMRVNDVETKHDRPDTRRRFGEHGAESIQDATPSPKSLCLGALAKTSLSDMVMTAPLRFASA